MNFMPLPQTCAETELSYARKMNASLRWSIRKWRLSTELSLAWDLESVYSLAGATKTDA